MTQKPKEGSTLRPLEPCWWCQGTGQIPTLVAKGSHTFRICPRCDGTGKIAAFVDRPLPGEIP